MERLASDGLRLEGFVHDGARSTVYRATRLADGEPVIVKVLTVTSDDEDGRFRLRRELTIARRIDAPSVVRAYGLTEHDGRLALVLEDFGGVSLEQERAGRRPLAAALPIAIGIARGIAAIHRAGVVHRDIKPSNVIHLARTGTIKLTDLGAAIVRDEFRARSGLEGTLAYMAPEQSGRMGRVVDHRADLYAFGVLLYELFTGALPFHAHDALAWMHCHAAQVPRPPSAVADGLPEVLSRLVLKLMAKAPEDRYHSAEGVEHDLGRVLAGDDGFGLAEHDVVSEFRLPTRVYGRDRELADIRAAFVRVADTSRSEVLRISGPAGIGKSALVRALSDSVTERGGYFAGGKFDQYRGHLPYSALTQACNALVHQLLTASPARLASWRASLLDAVDGNGAVLIELAPELERILGGQPPVAPLPATGAQHRLQHAVRALFRAFTEPVVLFLDDLQWADAASLTLLEAMTAQLGASPLLVVLAYRDGELTADLPAGHTVRLAPLDLEAIRALLRDTMHASASSYDTLAALALAKTGGNPFFVREFVRTLQLDGLLRFDASERAWGFAAREVEARAITDNVVDLMVERLRGLPAATREALRIAAFLGSELDVEDLAAVMERDADEVAGELRPAIDHGVIAVFARPDGATAVRFGHDRIQQAAYALTPEPARSAVRLRVARRWWARADRVFEVANHLEAALPLLTDPGERERALDLMVAAARRAKAATAYRQACAYLTRATELLTDAAWTARFELAFDVHVELSECHYLAGELDHAGALFDELLRRARTDLEQARIYYLQIRLFQVAGDMAGAADRCIRAFALLGLPAPISDDEITREVQSLHRLVAELVGDRPIAALADEPPMTDPRIRMLADLLEASGPPVYMVRPALFSWVALQLVNLSLRHGNTEASCYGYGIYALLRAAVLNDVDNGYAFSQLAIDLNQRLGGVKLAGCMLHLLGDHVNFWKHPVATDLPILQRGFAACVRHGDHIYSNYIGFQAPWHLHEAGAPLTEIAAMIDGYAQFARDTNYDAVHWTLRSERQLVRAMQGRTAGRGRLDGDDFSEDEALAAVTKARFGCGVVYLHILQMIARYRFGDHHGALAASRLAAPELGSAFSMPIYVSYVVYSALTIAAALPEQEPADRPALLEELVAHHEALRRWAQVNPANFADKAALVGAELCRIRGDVGGALRCYEEAQLAARGQGFLPYEALACELAARFYGALGVDSVKRTLLVESAALYGRWGASGKVAELQARHPGVLRGAASASALATSSITQASSSDGLELASVTKAAQSLSAEILLPRLLPRLMAIVVEYAGAERGALVVLDSGAPAIAATTSLDRAPAATEAAAVVPWSVVRYVQRTEAHVLIEDASVTNPFAADPYFAHRSHRSILGLPIQRQGRLMGMFYLENDQAAGTFGPERLATLEVLASQTAISIENSRLYEASQAAVRARDEFLSIASHELRTPLAPLAMQVHRLGSAVRKGTLKTMPDAGLIKLVATCEAQIHRMNRLVGALLDVSRIESGRMVLQPERLELATLVAGVVEDHAAAATAAGCVVTVRLAPGVVGRWDRLSIEQVVANLLLNAIKFGPGQPVEVEVRAADGRAVLAVTDRGIGVRPEDRARIFERFERVPTATNVDGLGLGLFIVRAIIEAHAGAITIDDGPSGGARFQIELPAG